MHIINSLKNKNVKRYLVLSVITVLICTVVIYSAIFFLNRNIADQVITKYNVHNLSESLALQEINGNISTILYIACGCIFCALILVVVYFFLALNKNEKEIKQMREYVKDISNRNYTVDLNNLSESEISNLKDEIYKIVLELKEKAENLATDRENLSSYLADISHQIRTPLMAITSMVDAIIENENNLDNSTRKFIYEISRQLNQINWLVDNLLKMAQLDTKTVEFNRESIRLKDFINKIENNLSIFLELKNQRLITNINENIEIFVDAKWLTEAIENIIKNCIEHSNENSKIIVSASQNSIYTQIEIIDSGNGISKEDLPKIFDKFYKGRGASNNSFGIGLSLAKSIIENQNGEIQVESEEGIGSKFIVKLYRN